MNIGLSLGLQKCFNNSPVISSAVRILTIFFFKVRAELNFGLPGIKAILSESAFSIELVNSFSLALHLNLNFEITKSLSNKVSLSRFLGTIFTFGEGRSITPLIHFFFILFWLGLSRFFVWLWSPLPLNWTVAVKKVCTVAVVDGRR